MPTKPDRLTVMTWPLASLWGKSLKEAVSDPFTRATGIPIVHAENTGLDYPPHLVAALETKRRPPYDIVYGNTIPAMQLAQAGFCDPMDESEFSGLTELHPRAKPQVPGVSNWPLVIAYKFRYVLMYREAAFPRGKPYSWEVLMDRNHQGRISLYPGGKGFFPIAQIMGGGLLADMPHNMKPCWDYLRALKPQLGPLGFNVAMTELVRRGEIDLFFTVLTNVRQWRQAGCGVFWTVPQEGATEGDDSLHVLSNLPDNVAYWAKQYVAFAMTEKIQKDWCHMLGVCPMYPDIPAPADLAEDPAYPLTPDDERNILTLPQALALAYEGTTWRDQFNEIMGFT